MRIPSSGQHSAGNEHVTMMVGDAAVAMRFYGDMLGGELVDDGRGTSWASWLPRRALRSGARRDQSLIYRFRSGPKLRLIPQRTVEVDTEGVPVVSFVVTRDALGPMQRRLEASGVRTSERRSAPTTSAVDFRDPFGNRLQLVADDLSSRVLSVLRCEMLSLALWYQWPSLPR
jgi:catechol 2,3-dioxygenase-like lactoylglutathione lyase family enzyme